MSGGQDTADEFNQMMLGIGQYKPTTISVDEQLLLDARCAVLHAKEYAELLISETAHSKLNIRESVWHEHLADSVQRFNLIISGLNAALETKEVNPNA